MEAAVPIGFLLIFGFSVWEWINFQGLRARATQTGIPVFRAQLDRAVWAFVTSGDPFGYRTRRTGELVILVRPVSRFEAGPSAAPFLQSVATVTADDGGVHLTAYLPSGHFAFGAFVVLASVAYGSLLAALLLALVGTFGLMIELNETRLCFGRLERIAVMGPPVPLADNQLPDNGELPRTPGQQ